MLSPLRVAPLIISAVVVLSACSGGDDGKKPASQVAAKVNQHEVSVHQVNAQLARAANVPPEQHETVRKQILEGLIDQQLLIDQALDKKLDRDPEVLTALEQARSQILAQSYLKKVLSSQPKPSPEVIAKYYEDNPALFSQRKVFRLQELSTNLPPERLKDLSPVLASAKSMTEVVAWIEKNQFQAKSSTTTRGAEQLPLQQVVAISALKDGGFISFIAEGRIAVLQVLETQAQPIDPVKASPLIEQFLTAQKRDEVVRDEVKRLRDAAKVEYVGEFVTTASTPASSTAPAPTPSPASGAASSASLTKGVADLK